MSASINIFEQHLSNIPHLVDEEADVDRYLRGLQAMLVAVDDDHATAAAMKDAVTFVAHDAFRSGFESCHDNVVLPLRQVTVTRDTAVPALTAYGKKIRNAISMAFEDEAGVPNSLTVAIDEVALPAASVRDLQ